jgi:hypothetical protein
MQNVLDFNLRRTNPFLHGPLPAFQTTWDWVAPTCRNSRHRVEGRRDLNRTLNGILRLRRFLKNQPGNGFLKSTPQRNEALIY